MKSPEHPETEFGNRPEGGKQGHGPKGVVFSPRRGVFGFRMKFGVFGGDSHS